MDSTRMRGTTVELLPFGLDWTRVRRNPVQQKQGLIGRQRPIEVAKNTKLNCRGGDREPRIGYARVSTDDQNLGPQCDSLRTVGCEAIFEEYASGGDRARSVVARIPLSNRGS